MYITILLFSGSLRLSLNTKMFISIYIYIYIKKRNGVDFTPCSYYSAWHDRWLVETLSQGCLRNNLLCLYKKKNTFECQKRMLFFLSPSQCICHSHAHHEHKSNLSWESGIFLCFFSSCDGSAGCLFLSLALIRKCSQHGVAFLNSRARRDAILSLLSAISRPCLRPRGTQIFMSFNVVSRSDGGLRLTALISPTEAHSQAVHELQTVCKLAELAGRDLKTGGETHKRRNNTRLIKTIR